MNPLFLASCALILVVGSASNAAELIAPDALTLMPATTLASLKTAAGTLHCAPGLCRTTFGPDSVYGEPDWSRHSIRFSRKGKPFVLRADSGVSGDPMYATGPLEIFGEDAYLPGDGCLYVHQSSNAYFTLTKRYCLTKGVLKRVKQETYPLNHTLRFETPLSMYATRETGLVLNILAAGESLHVLAALVDEDNNTTGQAKWFKVRASSGLQGWVHLPDDPYIKQCSGQEENDRVVCFNGD